MSNTKTQDKHDAKKAQAEKEAKIAERNAKMSPTLKQYRVNYTDSVTHTGRKSKICGDDLSHAMAAVEPSRAMKIAEALLDLDSGFLAAKYDRLNEGQRKMNSVNRIRAALKRDDLKLSEVKTAIRKIA